MKRLVAAMAVVISLATMSCTKSEESLQPNQSETESRRRPGGGGTSGVNTSIPAVTGVTATVNGPNSISLTWNSVPNATTYWIYRNGYVPAIVTSTGYTDALVSGGTTYTYEIAAVVNSHLGPKSVSVTVTTP